MKYLTYLFAHMGQLSFSSGEIHGPVVVSELFKLAILILLLVALYIWAAMVLLKLVGKLVPKSKIKITKTELLVLASAFIGIILCAYAYFVEPYTISVTHFQVLTNKLPKGSRPIKIVEIADLHCDPEPRVEDRLPEVIAAQKPDFIVFAGDSINVPEALPIFRKCMSRISKIAPTYAVRGNHDIREWRYLNLFGGTAVQELDGKVVQIPISATTIYLAGVAVDHESRMNDIFKQLPSKYFTIIAYHFPSQIYNIAKHKVDLFLTGHTHGGQVRLPLYGAIITRSRLGKQFEAGPYKVGDTWAYVNQGIGMEGGLVPRLRFLTPPEVTVIELTPASN